jgi:hypothetical protein
MRNEYEWLWAVAVGCEGNSLLLYTYMPVFITLEILLLINHFLSILRVYCAAVDAVVHLTDSVGLAQCEVRTSNVYV